MNYTVSLLWIDNFGLEAFMNANWQLGSNLSIRPMIRIMRHDHVLWIPSFSQHSDRGMILSLAGTYSAAMPESQDASCDGPTGPVELSQELDQIDLCPITLDDIKVDPHRSQTDDRWGIRGSGGSVSHIRQSISKCSHWRGGGNILMCLTTIQWPLAPVQYLSCLYILFLSYW